MVGDGFTFALIKPDLAVTAKGRILRLLKTDFDRFTQLTESVSSLPKDSESGFMGHRNYRVYHRASCAPFTILSVLQDQKIEKTRVYGFDKHSPTLEGAGGLLPKDLWELLGLVEEVPFSRDEEHDMEVLTRLHEGGRRLMAATDDGIHG